jgi:hypothetical protein
MSKWFLSNGINNMHILASGPEQQAITFGYVIVDENVKKGVILTRFDIPHRSGGWIILAKDTCSLTKITKK